MGFGGGWIIKKTLGVISMNRDEVTACRVTNYFGAVQHLLGVLIGHFQGHKKKLNIHINLTFCLLHRLSLRMPIKLNKLSCIHHVAK